MINLKIKTNILSDYWKPTPIKMRKLGDSILAASTTASGFAILSTHTNIGIAIAIGGVVGKFVTNFYKEDTTPDN